MVVLDTNVLSELVKPRPNPALLELPCGLRLPPRPLG